MKQIEDKEIEIQGTKQKYSDLILACVLVVPKEGFTRQWNKKIERIENYFEVKKDKYDVEDADFEFIKLQVLNMSWAIYDRKLTAFQDYIDSI